ncbi:MAG: 1-acyl-sn-glycerol-3-phosphate acyltransferase [Myxococcales bacterium]|nr:1-acyl-sn-glycerol-3-phosphate acyltransferase [Myxococcales bacterium]
MSTLERARWLAQWVPFGVRTVGYGALSVALGPLTEEHEVSLWAMRQWCRASVRQLRLSPEILGLGHVPASGGFVYAANHQSLLDILVLGAVLPGDFKWAAKRSLMQVPFLGWHLKLAGHVPVTREAGKRSAAEVIERFRKVLVAGKPLLIFPEGTRSPDGEVKDFKTGGFHAAVRADCPVIPVGLDGTGDVMKKGAADAGTSKQRKLQPLAVHIGAALHPDRSLKDKDRVLDLRDRTFAAVCALREDAKSTRLAAS